MSSMCKNITLIISDPKHPINSSVRQWALDKKDGKRIETVQTISEATGGDLCFLLSCNEIVPKEFLKCYQHVLVVHASDLPEGRGWSPHIWQIVNGATEIVVSLLEAAEKVDSGDILKKTTKFIPKYFIYDDIIGAINKAHLELMDYAIDNYGNFNFAVQSSQVTPTYFLKRSPEDSEINADLSIASQFDAIRVCDEKRFPCFFYLHGEKFKLILEKYNE